MYMSSLFRLLLLLGCFSVASSVHAVSYQWYVNSEPSYRYGSAQSACSAYAARRDQLSINSGSPYRYTGPSVSAAPHPTQFICQLTKISIINASYSVKEESLGTRSGDSCPEGSILTNNLECVAPPDVCAELAGQTTNFFSLAPPGSSSLPGEHVCLNSCQAAWSGDCGANSAGQSACSGLATYTGSSCQPGDNPAGPPPPVDDPDAPTCPPGYSWSGTTCVADNPPDPEDPEDPEDPDGPDEPCEGDDCPPPCEGDDCPDDGDNNGGDDDGNDGGDDGGSDSAGDTGKDPDGVPCNPLRDPNCTPCNPAIDPTCASAVSGFDSCTDDINCKGDAIQCAILRTQKKQLCQTQWNAQVEAQVAAAVSGPQFELEEKTIPVAGLFNEAVNKGRWLNSTCPSPRNVTVMGKSIQLSFEPICDFATALGPLIVAFASIAFAMIIGKGLKGN